MIVASSRKEAPGTVLEQVYSIAEPDTCQRPLQPLQVVEPGAELCGGAVCMEYRSCGPASCSHRHPTLLRAVRCRVVTHTILDSCAKGSSRTHLRTPSRSRRAMGGSVTIPGSLAGIRAVSVQ
ncbi:hypothetical protein K466DRAFT_57888 [Polyporus arcularius HHB13444]|uniref:Uncharacterized protein n=1 Tax=Polyporus arcularius HHB13444 TaxID=1314778 RepID=A0A5C3PI15_9APHY|nr:hypothetical protein K466DRAFT_57888 [Polyporus arcularius HHB13444]